MELRDKTLTCVECGEEFLFSADEQLFFREKGFLHERKRCGSCKAKRAQGPARVQAMAICSACGRSTIVPFRPHRGRLVLCRSCFRGNMQERVWVAAARTTPRKALVIPIRPDPR